MKYTYPCIQQTKYKLTASIFNIYTNIHRYEPNGDVKGECEMIPPNPIRLQWDIKADGQIQIETAAANAQKLINDLDLRIYVHDHYGKGFMKKCRISPDAYIQMALQLAYFRDAGRFSLTYEASMTRLFREGRTETVRPCTIESSAWVNAMVENNTSSEEKIKLLRIACEQHQVTDDLIDRNFYN